MRSERRVRSCNNSFFSLFYDGGYGLEQVLVQQRSEGMLNNGVVLIFIGEMGGGKTLSAVRQCYAYYRKGFTIYSNIKLAFPYKEFSLKAFLKMKEDKFSMRNSVIFIDEIHIWADSRNSQKKRNKVMGYLINQTRKRSVRVLGTTQSFDLVEKRIRNRTNLLTYCRKGRKDGKPIIIQELAKLHSRDLKIRKSWFFASPYYRLYDTDEIVDIPDDEEE